MVLAKLSIVIGAGIVGSIVTSKDGGFSDVVNLFSGAYKIVTKHLQQEKSSSGSTGKPQTNALIEQINKLRDELQRAKPQEKLIIISGSRRGYGGFGVKAVIVVGVTGYIVLWWKGWKLSNFMFVTRRGFSDAVNKVAKQLDHVSSSIAAAKRHLSSRIDRVDINLDECKEITTATKDEVSMLHGDLSLFHTEVESVHRVVQTLETKLSRIEGSQEFATQGVYHLCQFVERLENGGNKEFTQGLPPSSQGVPGFLPPAPVVSRASLPLEARSVSASSSAPYEAHRVSRPSMAIPPSGLQVKSNTNSAGSSKLVVELEDTLERRSGNFTAEEPKSSTPTTSRWGWTFNLLSRRPSTDPDDISK